MARIRLFVLFFFAVALLQINANKEWRENKIFKYDASGYYLYLPAVFLHHDLGTLEFYKQLDTTIRPSNDQRWYGLYYQEATGRRLDKYPSGVAFAELPFYALGRVADRLFGAGTEPVGYSQNHRFLICLATMVWTCIGLLFLGAALKRLWKSDAVVLITLALLAFGTNLYTYSVTNFGLSHTLAFLLFAALLYNILSWETTHRPRHLYGIAIACGWIFLTRPPDITVYMLPVAYGIYSAGFSAKNRPYLIRQQPHVAGALLCVTALLFVQLLYWKWTTGHFFYYSYEGEAFDFRHPSILNGLFSWQKGWFVYTPLALLALLGFIPLYRRAKGAALLLLVYFAATVYLVFSWEQWWYGWGFGCRALIESLAVLSIPLSALVAAIRSGKTALKAGAAAVALFVVFLNVFQTNQHIIQTLPGERMTKAYYWRIWLKMEADEADRQLLQ